MINAQNYYTLKLFRNLNKKFQPAFLHCPKEFIRCECIVNLIEGNLTGLRRNQFTRFQKQLRKLTSKSTTLSSRRLILGSKAGITILSYIYQPCMNKFSTFFNESGQKVLIRSKKNCGKPEKGNHRNPTARFIKKKKQFSQLSKK